MHKCMATVMGIEILAFLLLLLPSSYGILMVRQNCSNYTDNCITLPACLEDIPECFENDSTLEFGPGVHKVPLEQPVFYVISNLSNITLQTEMPSNSTIDCLSGRASFAFTNINNLTLKDIAFENCGVSLGTVINKTNHPPLALTFHEDQNISLFLANIQDLTMDRITVRNGSGIGMAAINVLGRSWVRYCSFEYNNIALIEDMHMSHKSYCTSMAGQTACNGGNAAFLYTDTSQNMSLVGSTLEIERSSFYRGISYIYDDHSQVTYNPSADKYLIVGGGLSIVLTQNAYSVNISLVNATCAENMGFKGANLYIILYSGVTFSSITVTGGNVTGGNLLIFSPKLNDFVTEGVGGGVYYEYGRHMLNQNQSQQKISKNATVNVVFKGMNIYGNQAQTGGGMVVRLHLQPNSKVPFTHQLILQDVVFHSNTGYFGAAITVSETQFQQVLSRGAYNIQYNKVFNTTLLNVMILRNRSPTYGLDSGFGSAVCFNGASVILLTETLIMENECMGILLMDTQLSMANVTVYNNHGAKGGGMGFLSKSIIFLHPHNTIVNISNNHADYGGGIYVFSLNYADISPLCFFQVYPETEVPWVTSMDQYNATVVLENNSAKIGQEIYGGDLDNCYLMYLDWKSQKAFKKFVKVNYTNGSTEVTSDAYTICFCEDNQPKCNQSTLIIYAYLGEAIEISTVAVGQLQGVTKQEYLTTISAPDFEYLDIKINSTDNNNNASCFNSTLMIKTNQTHQHNFVKFYISIEGQVQQYYWKQVKMHIDPCPIFFERFKDHRGLWQCSCMDILLEDKLIQCIPEKGRIRKARGDIYVGYHNNCTYIHEHCPFDYCNTKTETLSGTSQNDQCINNRRGLLCGECQPGHSVVLGSNQCQYCSNLYLILLIPFAVAGIALVWVVCYFNLTVSTGALNGLIFYANIVHINKGILYPNKDNLLTVFIDWLNLDLGINTCFYNGLDSYTKSYLQFAFPVYIWMLSLLTIYLSRHFPIAYRVFGEHSTQALATLLLLSFNKILNNVAAIFSVTDLRYQCEDGEWSTIHVWSKEANISFFQGKHLFLMVFGMLCLVLLILPFMALLLLSPSLQRKTHYPCLHWMIRLKPFIDAYHGPYNVRWRCWGGVLLLVRGGLLLAFVLNRRGSPHLQLLFITFTALSLLPVIVYGNGIYRSGLMNACEAAAIGNLALYSATAQFCLTQGGKCQIWASYLFLSIALGQLMAVVIVYGGLRHKGFWQTKVLVWIPDAEGLRRALCCTGHNPQSGYEVIGRNDNSSSEVELSKEESGNEWNEAYREPLLSLT